MSLHASDLQKLAKLLGMIGSHHDCEALSAARKAHQFITSKGATWHDAFGVAEVAAPSPAHHNLATDLLRHKAYLTDFERRFLIGIMAHAKLSPKQAQTLEIIRVKVATACDIS
jgi:hypothetical protein